MGLLRGDAVNGFLAALQPEFQADAVLVALEFCEAQPLVEVDGVFPFQVCAHNDTMIPALAGLFYQIGNDRCGNATPAVILARRDAHHFADAWLMPDKRSCGHQLATNAGYYK